MILKFLSYARDGMENFRILECDDFHVVHYHSTQTLTDDVGSEDKGRYDVTVTLRPQEGNSAEKLALMLVSSEPRDWDCLFVMNDKGKTIDKYSIEEP